MGSNLVIVAIPDENDRVWTVSSEKVPHLTLLFLGEADKAANLEQIVEFVQHASDTTLRRFYLSVDRRDTLGPDEADVLFFRKGYDTKAIRDFRSTLLKDNNIRTAYDSATQFEGPWLPHLTLGYPATPAKEIPDNEVDRFYDVSFNKIAVWTEDSDGPEFLLKDYWDEMEDEAALAMSQINAQEAISQNAARIAAGMEVLDHSGVKGMKWGVRKDIEGSAARGAFRTRPTLKKYTGRAGYTPRTELRLAVFGPGAAFDARVRSELKSADQKVKIGKADKQWEKALNDGTAWVAVNNASAEHFNKHIDAINNNPKYSKDRDWSNEDYSHPKDPVFKTYLKDIDKLTQESIQHAATQLYLKNPSGTKEVEVKSNGLPGDFTMTVKDTAKHADDGAIHIKVDYQTDNVGRVIGFTYSDDTGEMAQTADLGAVFIDEFMHSGVKGMKWGVRKDRLQEGLHNRRVAAEGVRREKRPAKDIKAYPTIGSSKRQKAKIDTKGGEDHPPTEDAIKVAAARQKLRKSGVHSLSNEELRLVANRLNLEQQVANLESKKVRKSMGRDFVDSVIKDKGNQKTASKFAVKQILKKAGKAGAVAAL